jgi:hypothetical protein
VAVEDDTEEDDNDDDAAQEDALTAVPDEIEKFTNEEKLAKWFGDFRHAILQIRSKAVAGKISHSQRQKEALHLFDTAFAALSRAGKKLIDSDPDATENPVLESGPWTLSFTYARKAFIDARDKFEAEHQTPRPTDEDEIERVGVENDNPQQIADLNGDDNDTPSEEGLAERRSQYYEEFRANLAKTYNSELRSLAIESTQDRLRLKFSGAYKDLLEAGKELIDSDPTAEKNPTSFYTGKSDERDAFGVTLEAFNAAREAYLRQDVNKGPERTSEDAKARQRSIWINQFNDYVRLLFREATDEAFPDGTFSQSWTQAQEAAYTSLLKARDSLIREGRRFIESRPDATNYPITSLAWSQLFATAWGVFKIAKDRLIEARPQTLLTDDEGESGNNNNNNNNNNNDNDSDSGSSSSSDDDSGSGSGPSVPIPVPTFTPPPAAPVPAIQFSVPRLVVGNTKKQTQKDSEKVVQAFVPSKFWLYGPHGTNGFSEADDAKHWKYIVGLEKKPAQPKWFSSLNSTRR